MAKHSIGIAYNDPGDDAQTQIDASIHFGGNSYTQIMKELSSTLNGTQND